MNERTVVATVGSDGFVFELKRIAEPGSSWILDVYRAGGDRIIATRVGNPLDWVLAVVSNHVQQSYHRVVAQLSLAAGEGVLHDVVDCAVDGMLTDGEHHKQWYLEDIAKRAIGSPMVPMTAVDVRGVEYSYQYRSRQPLADLLAKEPICTFFDDDDRDRPDHDEWSEIESGVAP